MTKLYILLLLFIVSLPINTQNAHAEYSSRTETILFYATGFTNKAGDLKTQKQRAVQAAKYLVEKKIGSLFGKTSTTRGLPSVLPSNWADWIKVIEITEVNSQKTGRNLFGVKIFGKVAIAIPPGATLTENNTSTSFLRIAFGSNKSIYYHGEEIAFSLRGNKDFHACILDINNKKEIVQLLPNKYSPDNRFSSETEHSFPRTKSGGGFTLQVSPPYGTDMIHLIASSYPIASLLPRKSEDVFASSNKNVQTLLNNIYDNILHELKQQNNNKFYEFVQLSTHVLPLKTQKK